MTKTATILIVLALTASGCKGNRWYGTVSGKATVNSNVQRPASAVRETSHASTSGQNDSDDVLLEREGAAAFLTFRKCRLRMDLDDATRAHVSEGQTCTIVIDGESSRMKMKGTASFDSADTFSAEITGTPTEAGVSGEYAWKFSGARKS